MAEEIEKTPMGDTALNKPASGTYGEKAELDRLKADLPAMERQGAPKGAGPMRTVPGKMPQRPMGAPANAPSGMPAGLMAPTNQPDRPMNSPLTEAPEMPPRNSAEDQQRIAILGALETHPNVSAETREWAGLVKEYLLAGRG